MLKTKINFFKINFFVYFFIGFFYFIFCLFWKNSKPIRSCVLGATSHRNLRALPSRSALGCASGTTLGQRAQVSMLGRTSDAASNINLAIRSPPDIRPRPLPGLIFSNIRPRSVTNWISTCGVNRFATCSVRSAECHRVKPTANQVCVISEVTGAQLVTAAQHTLRRVGSL